MNEWRPLSMRQGQKEVPQLREEFSPAATHALVYLLEGQFGYRGRPRTNEALIVSVALACDVEVQPDVYDPSPMRQLLDAAAYSDPVMLDVLDATLHRGPATGVDTLRTLLADAFSVWTISANNKGLERRVTPSAGDALLSATAPTDEASAELSEAWTKAYGRKPDASDAWITASRRWSRS